MGHCTEQRPGLSHSQQPEHHRSHWARRSAGHHAHWKPRTEQPLASRYQPTGPQGDPFFFLGGGLQERAGLHVAPRGGAPPALLCQLCPLWQENMGSAFRTVRGACSRPQTRWEASPCPPPPAWCATSATCQDHGGGLPGAHSAGALAQLRGPWSRGWPRGPQECCQDSVSAGTTARQPRATAGGGGGTQQGSVSAQPLRALQASLHPEAEGTPWAAEGRGSCVSDLPRSSVPPQGGAPVYSPAT